jgi:hypothetical protein
LEFLHFYRRFLFLNVDMQDIEPFFKWRDQYIASEDPHSPFFRRQYSELYYTHSIYNYYIHPQWDDMDSETLFVKILFVDYAESFAIIELIGEWNDAIQNDIMYLKRKIADPMLKHGIKFFILVLDNVLNFHSSDDCYYEEWYEEVSEESGWICFLGVQEHLEDEMVSIGLQHYIHFGPGYNDLEWRRMSPGGLMHQINQTMKQGIKRLRY